MIKKLKNIILIIYVISGLTVNAQGATKDPGTLAYIERFKDIAMEEMAVYKIPASITLAQGILESGHGTGTLAVKGNNHFGIKCHADWTGKTMKHDDDAPQECFRVYKNPEESYRDHSKFLKNSSRYAFLFDLEITDYKGWAKGLKKAGYATSPVYASALINLIEDYELQQYDQMVVKNKFKIKQKQDKDSKSSKNSKKDSKTNSKTNKTVKKKAAATVLPVPVLNDCKVVEMTKDHHFIRENFGVKFVTTKDGDKLEDLAKELKISQQQLIKYNNLGNKKTFKEGEVLYVGPKRRKAASGYNVHIIKQGETLSEVSRLYAVRLDRLFIMNGLDENSVLSIGQEIKLR